jgi:phosphopantetheinyl transferase
MPSGSKQGFDVPVPGLPSGLLNRTCRPGPCPRARQVVVYRVNSNDWRRYLGAVPADERRTARNKLRPQDRHAFLACRGFLRTALGRWLGRAPGSLPIRIDGRKRPFLARCRIAFSVSHAGTINLVGFAVGRRLGVDIAYRGKARAVDAIADGYFPAADRAAILAAPRPARQRALLRAWTRHEALAKATGVGLVIPAESAMPAAYGLGVRIVESRDGQWIAAVAADGPTRCVRFI